MDITSEFSQRYREEALKKYEEEKAKFRLRMMVMGYYKVKSLLNEEGIRKIGIIDQRREKDKVFNEDFSSQIWRNTEEVYSNVVEQLITKMIDTYGLKIEKDLKDYFDRQENENSKLDFYA